MGEQTPTSDPLGELRDLCEALVQAERLVEERKDELDRAKADYQRLRTEVIPEMMFEIGLSELKLQTGEKVTITPDVQCGITAANRTAAHRWLNENGFGGLIKVNAKVAFAASEHDDAEQATAALIEQYGDRVALEESVHHSTLKSFVKEQMNKGNEVPQDLFGIFPFNVAKISR